MSILDGLMLFLKSRQDQATMLDLLPIRRMLILIPYYAHHSKFALELFFHLDYFGKVKRVSNFD